MAAISGVVIAAIATLLIVGLINRNVNNSIDAVDRQGRARTGAGVHAAGADQHGRAAAGRARTCRLPSCTGIRSCSTSGPRGACPAPTRRPILQSIWNRYRAQGVYVLGVDVKDLTGDALGFHKEYGLTFPTVRDGEGNIEGPYGTTGVPESFIIDRNGKIAAALRGPLTASGSSANVNSFVSVLDSVVAERS